MLVRMQQMIELCYESEGRFLGGCCEFWGGRCEVGDVTMCWEVIGL